MKNLKSVSLLVAGFAMAMQCIAASPQTGSIARPKLVVNIVIGGLPYDFFALYGRNLPDGGFRRFMEDGMVFTSGRYSYMPTNSASSLAVVTTGSYPAVNGVVGREWYDVLTGDRVDLIYDESVTGLEREYGEGCYSNDNLTTPTLGDRLLRESPASKVFSVAADPVSSIVMAGLDGVAYWVNPATAGWTSSSSFMTALPEWVDEFNDQYKDNSYFNEWFWTLRLASDKYVNRRYVRDEFLETGRFHRMESMERRSAWKESGRYAAVYATPLASDLVSDFAMRLVQKEQLGEDDAPDILNICFDAPRDIIGHYGPESVEAEDMFYQLDRTLGGLMRFISNQVGSQVLFVVTADHGSAPSYDAETECRERFNGEQFRTIVNSFLCAQYGGDNWITGYDNRRLYINRNNVFERKLSLDEVQRLASSFALQFRGITRVVPSCDLRGGAAGDVYMERLRNGYYPKRSGDILVDLVPCQTEMADGMRTGAGSAYDYDVHVPLMMTGCGLPAMVVADDVDMASLPVSEARILGIQNPEAATAAPIGEIMDLLK